MLDPQIVEGPILQPGRCYRCGAFTGPMVDTMIEVPAGGRFYICVKTCLNQYATLAGYWSPEHADARTADLDALATERDELLAKLETEADHKFLSRDELREELRVLITENGSKTSVGGESVTTITQKRKPKDAA